jgi:hypothetical protein
MASPTQTDVPGPTLDRMRRICAALPETVEEQAWVGTRWRIRTKTFAHVLVVHRGWPPAYARALGAAAPDRGPTCVLTFRAEGDELDVLRHGGPPFFAPAWFPDIVGLVLGGATDWDDVADLCTDSYCHLAPRALAARVTRPG